MAGGSGIIKLIKTISHNRTTTSNSLIGISLHNENPIKQIEAMKPVYKRFGHNLMKGNQEPNKLKSKGSKKVSFGKLENTRPHTRPCMDRVQKNKRENKIHAQHTRSCMDRAYDTRPAYTPVYGPCTEEKKKKTGHTPTYTPVYGPCV